MLSPEGRCKTFDASADGAVRSEGCGMVVLKRLHDAEADGDRIWGVVRGTAVNQNGATAGPTVPSGRAQQRVIGGGACARGRRAPGGGLSGSSWSGIHAGGSDRGAVGGRGLRRGTRGEPSTPDRLRKDQHRPSRVGCGNRGADQGHAVHEARRDTEAPPFQGTQRARGLEGASRAGDIGGDAVAPGIPTGLDVPG